MTVFNKHSEGNMTPIKGKPRYHYDEIVRFSWGTEEKTGKIRIIDAYGTFEQNEEPSYDILVEESGLYKHVRESEIIEIES